MKITQRESEMTTLSLFVCAPLIEILLAGSDDAQVTKNQLWEI